MYRGNFTKMCTLFLVSMLLMPVFSFGYHEHSSIDTTGLDTRRVEEFFIPVLFGVAKDDVVPDFGAPRGGGTRSHEGQDFVVPKGTPVISPTEAVVLSTGDGESSGLYVSTMNPGGEMFRYMHLDSIADIKRGDRLAVGDLIGTVGDTGNAPDGVYHLHFEVWNEDKEAIDPYERLGNDLSLKQKSAYLDQVVAGIDGSVSTYLKSLVTTFATDFAKMQSAGYELPSAIEKALKASGSTSTSKDQKTLRTVASKIPALLPTLQPGDSGPAVQLLQLYLMIVGEGSAIDKLALAGPTGYYGPTTSAAVKAWQARTDLKETGTFDTKTKLAWSKQK